MTSHLKAGIPHLVYSGVYHYSTLALIQKMHEKGEEVKKYLNMSDVLHESPLILDWNMSFCFIDLLIQLCEY